MDDWELELQAIADRDPGVAEMLQQALAGEKAAGAQVVRAFQQGMLDEDAAATVQKMIDAGLLAMPDEAGVPNLPQRPVPSEKLTPEQSAALAKSLRKDPYGYLESHDYGGVYSVEGSGLPPSRLSDRMGDTARTFAEPGMAEWEYKRRLIPQSEWPPEIPMAPGEKISPLANTELRRFGQSEKYAEDIEARNKLAPYTGDPISPPGQFRVDNPPKEALPGFEGAGTTGKSPESMNDDELKRYYMDMLRAQISAGKTPTSP